MVLGAPFCGLSGKTSSSGIISVGEEGGGGWTLTGAGGFVTGVAVSLHPLVLVAALLTEHVFIAQGVPILLAHVAFHRAVAPFGEVA